MRKPIVHDTNMNVHPTTSELNMEMCRRTASINMNNRINLDLNESISRNGSIIDDDSGCISDNVFDRKVIINENDQKIKVKKHTIQTEMDDHHDYDDIIEKYFSFIFAFYRKNIIWFYLLYFTCYNVFFAFAIHRTWHKVYTIDIMLCYNLHLHLKSNSLNVCLLSNRPAVTVRG